jgi:hypothetical protein
MRNFCEESGMRMGFLVVFYGMIIVFRLVEERCVVIAIVSSCIIL